MGSGRGWVPREMIRRPGRSRIPVMVGKDCGSGKGEDKSATGKVQQASK